MGRRGASEKDHQRRREEIQVIGRSGEPAVGRSGPLRSSICRARSHSQGARVSLELYRRYLRVAHHGGLMSLCVKVGGRCQQEQQCRSGKPQECEDGDAKVHTGEFLTDVSSLLVHHFPIYMIDALGPQDVTAAAFSPATPQSQAAAAAGCPDREQPSIRH